MAGVELSETEVRVLGCLIEKRATTPEHYPLTTKALTNACNQTSSRDPVMNLSNQTVVQAMMELRANKLCRTAISGRTDKHKHVLDEVWHLSPEQLAVLAVMALRGPQTPGELRTRTDRYVQFESLEGVQATLTSLSSPDTEGRPALALDLGRGPGQSQNRWSHLLAGRPEILSSEVPGMQATSDAEDRPSRSARIDQLESTVSDLEARLTRIETELGLGPPPG